MENSYVIQKLCVAKGILNKIKYYVPQSTLKNIYFGLAHPYLYYGVTSWGNTALMYTHKTQVQLNTTVKIITRSSFFKTRLSPLYTQLNLIRNYSARFAPEYNWVAVMRCNKTLSQRSIKIEGHRLWNSLPEEIKIKYYLNNKMFFNKLKKFLIENTILSKKDIEE